MLAIEAGLEAFDRVTPRLSRSPFRDLHLLASMEHVCTSFRLSCTAGVTRSAPYLAGAGSSS